MSSDAQTALAEVRVALDGGDFGPMLAPAVEKVLAHVEAQAAEIERLRKLLCKCDMRTRLVGDGCEFCNPTLADELAKEQR